MNDVTAEYSSRVGLLILLELDENILFVPEIAHETRVPKITYRRDAFQTT